MGLLKKKTTVKVIAIVGCIGILMGLLYEVINCFRRKKTILSKLSLHAVINSLNAFKLEKKDEHFDQSVSMDVLDCSSDTSISWT